ncbi:uncharacterized mitochondrial protein AtMg00810-like [Ziziphus jujuba]|uniref:Uncharacterized mitochondrial protein AtMg00810-like n=1 Tax=Ziziphus jujuba TaxID=326968 RepID=A0ABM4A268_ZIZJJ|nr:uncharacterized mitochondrial protein AtMg00810-like [Ziziphus jujuba]
MEQPPGFLHPLFPHHVCLLHKSLKGLKQAPRAWFERLSSSLLKIGFLCSSSALISHIIQKLSLDFALKDLGIIHYFLGLEAKFFNGGLFLSQSKYTCDLLQRANMLHALAISTPIATKITPSIDDDDAVDATEYRSIVEALQYLTFTRPDIQHAVNRACQHLHSPTRLHLKAVKRILWYLKGKMNFGLRFLAQSHNTLSGCSDADWAGCPLTCRSTTDYCVFFGVNCISWSSKKQSTMARSSMKQSIGL